MQPNPPVDPIRTNYFDIIEDVDKWANRLFLLGALLSIASTFIPETRFPTAFSWVQIFFLVTVLGLFVIDLAVKLYLSPRAADARAQDFLSHAYGQNLSTTRTQGYYNNNAPPGMHKIAAQTFENALFTKEISRSMFKRQIPWVAFYVAIFAVGLACRDTPVTLWCASAQVLFGEQIIVRFARLSWLRARAESIFGELQQLYFTPPSGVAFDTIAMDAYTRYESSKSTAGITLSSRIYEELNPQLTVEWDRLRGIYGIP
nr:hypothetical protein [uncultured Duganella sp.]